MLGTIAGFWISLFLMVVIFVGIIAALVSSDVTSSVDIQKKSVLYLDLSGDMPERTQTDDLWSAIFENKKFGDSFIDVVNSIRLAKNDSKIEGLYINAGGSTAGFAAREEILNAIKDFKESGKWVYAYADSYSQGDYLISSCADSLFVNPVGAVGIHGVASQIPFFTGFLEKIGVKMQVVRVGSFKSAIEPFVNKTISEASRLQTQTMIDSIWKFYNLEVSENRKVGKNTVNLWADSMISTWDKTRLLESGAVSALRYRRNVEDLLISKCGKKDMDDMSLVTPSEYMMSQKMADGNKKHIAVLFAVGDIVDSGKWGIVGEKMAPEIIRLADDENVAALVLRVNSGGGSGFASEQIWEALEYFKSKDKEFYVSMGDYAASGGYYISCGADRIYADCTTITGSIGVFGMIPDFSGLVSDKLGITFANIESNPNAIFPNVMEPLSVQQLEALQHSVENFYEIFVNRVADGRDIPVENVKEIAQGRVWIGGDALRLGLVDEIGGLNNAISDISEKVGLSVEKVVYYPKIEDKLLLSLIANAQDNVNSHSVVFSEEAKSIVRFVERLGTLNPIQARMPELKIY